ncbi:ATP-binding protein [uncultured Erythrobacter sp.]|uniref:ATP-binding protein n=1 Tax=uncultured Erythrobacter sp. TaxID=263913 RepID=UPI00260D7DFF|nr:ATP-binding protein [uncultured Erythrobacter sp.]
MTALALALHAAISPSSALLAVEPALLVLGLGATALGLREFSVRMQFSAQAAASAASLQGLRDKVRWLKMTEAHAKVGHWRLDLVTNEVFWSDATFAIHGLKPAGTPPLEDAISFYHPDDQQTVREKIERSRSSGQPYAFKARLIGADGVTRHVDSGASVVSAPDGTPAALFGVIRDRSDEEEMQRELREARDEAKALARSKGTFLARMSHEIRTPMNGVLGFAELLHNSELNPQQKRHIDLIVESGKSLQTLLNDILDLSKIEAGKVEVTPGTVDLMHLLYRVTQMAEPAAREKGIGLVYDTSPDLPRHVVLDALRLRQVLGNLLANAVRFTDEGGISLSASCVEGKLRFAVCDTGCGIASGMQDEIFDPFTQERSHATLTRGGTGLGLAISRQLAGLMGGTLTVRSEPGEGSVFTLTVPLVGCAAPEKGPKQDGPTPIRSGSKHNARILLAEDYDINRELITDMGTRLGHEIECAEDGIEAVTLIQHARAIGRPFSLVLMDLQMPRLDGLEATQRLRKDGVTPEELPIIALTANAFADDVENCLNAGMQAHLSKPVSLERLEAALDQWLSKSTVDEAQPSESAERETEASAA